MADYKYTVTDDKGNLIDIKYDHRGKWATQKMSFVDENGNRLRYDLQSCQQSTGVTVGGGMEVFKGYSVYPFNNEPDVDVVDEASAKIRDVGYDKIYKDAEKYFNEHPEERPKDGHGRRITYITQYVNIQAGKYMRKRVEEGKGSSLEQVYIHSLDRTDNKLFYAWEQITGAMPANAPEAEVEKALLQDTTHEIMRAESTEMQESIKRGTASLENRVAEAQNARYTIRTKKRGDGGQTMEVTREKPDNTTFNEDEKNALIQRRLEMLMGKSGGR